MINDIKIIIINDLKSNEYLIDVKNLSYIYNNKRKDISINKINELLSIIKLWNKEYYKNIIDDEEFIIEINTNNGKTIFHGKGEYPDNYDLFKEWIRSL